MRCSRVCFHLNCGLWWIPSVVCATRHNCFRSYFRHGHLGRISVARWRTRCSRGARSARVDLIWAFPNAWREQTFRSDDYHPSRVDPGGDFVYYDPRSRRKIANLPPRPRSVIVASRNLVRVLRDTFLMGSKPVGTTSRTMLIDCDVRKVGITCQHVIIMKNVRLVKTVTIWTMKMWRRCHLQLELVHLLIFPIRHWPLARGTIP